MSGWIARRLLTGNTITALFGLVVATSFCPSAKSAEAVLHDDDVPPDLDYIRAKAEEGASKAQTLLGDFLTTSGDFTNAVLWYRKAAQQNDVGAQLTLASCLVTGRGAAKDPAEAARWLREAARLIESPAPRMPPQLAAASAPATSPARATIPPVSSRAEIVSAPVAASAPAPQPVLTNAPADPAEPNPAPTAAFVRVQRAQSLSAANLVLLERTPVVKSYPDSR